MIYMIIHILTHNNLYQRDIIVCKKDIHYLYLKDIIIHI